MRLPPDQITLTLVNDEASLAAFRDWVPGECGMVSCDIETTGLQPYGTQADTIRLVQFGDENHGWALPFGSANWYIVEEALDRFKGRIVNHNARFDEAFLGKAGFDTGSQWDDSYIAHHLLHPGEWHGLKPIAGEFYGREVRAGERWLDKAKAQNGWDWATVPVDHPAYWGYAAMDTCLTARIWNDLSPRLESVRPQYEREMRMARLMAGVSERGLAVDTEHCVTLLGGWAVEQETIKNWLELRLIDNPQSGAQVAAALMNEGWEPDILTPTGKVAVNKDVLGGLDNDIAKMVLRYRRLNKWAVAYVRPMLESGGRLHANIAPLRAATGRMAVSDPPLQQLPSGPEVRRAIVADEGTEMWAIDYTGQEARLLAAYVGDPVFSNEVLHGGDIHGNIAYQLYGPDYTKEQRMWAKNGFYAYCYGAEDKRLALTTHSGRGEFKRAVKDSYPQIDKFMRTVVAKGKQRIEDDGKAWAKTVGGRTVAVSKSKVYALTNYIMQGGGSDLVKAALERIEDAGLADSVRLVIHDEVLCCFPEGEGKAMAETVAECMETEFRGVPFEAHATGPGANWGDVA